MEREVRIDIVKGIAITLMVIGHTAAPFGSFIALFHMAVFFMVSGYLYNQSYSKTGRNLIKYIYKKICTLWFPFFLWNTIYSIFHNFFIKVNVYTDNESFLTYCKGNLNQLSEYWTLKEVLNNIIKSAFFAGDTQLGGAFWFFKILFALSILYAIIEYILMKACNNKTEIVQCFISLLLLSIGYLCSRQNVNFFSIQIVCSCYSLYHIGILIRYKENCIYSRKKHMILLGGAFVSLYIFNYFLGEGAISLGANRYPDPFCMLLVSWLGWILLSEIAYFLEKSVLKKIFVYLGRSTRSILIFHFLCFKVVSYIGVMYESKPYYLVASFPVLYEEGLWWIAYSIAGLAIPIFLDRIYKKGKFYIMKWRRLHYEYNERA